MKSLRKIMQKEKNWEIEKDILEREIKISNEKKELKKRKKPSSSKMLVWFLFINCTIIELFTGFITVWSMYITSQTFSTPDFMPLVTLIGAVVSEVIGFAIYSIKSAKENCKDGIVYEKAMLSMKDDDILG